MRFIVTRFVTWNRVQKGFIRGVVTLVTDLSKSMTGIGLSRFPKKSERKWRDRQWWSARLRLLLGGGCSRSATATSRTRWRMSSSISSGRSCSRSSRLSRCICAQLKELGALVVHRIDATRLQQTLAEQQSATPATNLLEPYDAIVFNHPHCGEENLRRHQMLLSHFYHAARALLAVIDAMHDNCNATGDCCSCSFVRSRCCLTYASEYEKLPSPSVSTRRRETNAVERSTTGDPAIFVHFVVGKLGQSDSNNFDTSVTGYPVAEDCRFESVANAQCG